jgi:hypothetical protein
MFAPFVLVRVFSRGVACTPGDLHVRLAGRDREPPPRRLRRERRRDAGRERVELHLQVGVGLVGEHDGREPVGVRPDLPLHVIDPHTDSVGLEERR